MLRQISFEICLRKLGLRRNCIWMLSLTIPNAQNLSEAYSFPRKYYAVLRMYAWFQPSDMSVRSQIQAFRRLIQNSMPNIKMSQSDKNFSMMPSAGLLEVRYKENILTACFTSSIIKSSEHPKQPPHCLQFPPYFPKHKPLSEISKYVCPSVYKLSAVNINQSSAGSVSFHTTSLTCRPPLLQSDLYYRVIFGNW